MRRPVAARLILLASALVLAAAALLAAAPGEAFAKSYDMTKVDITAQAETDGSLHAVEQRTFDFNGDFTAVWWTFEGLPSNAELKVNSVRMARVDGDGNVVGEWETLPGVPFVLDWRDAGGPGTDAYSVDAPKNTVYAFFDVSDEKAVIELDYTVVNGVQAYKDVAEVNWKYAVSYTHLAPKSRMRALPSSSAYRLMSRNTTERAPVNHVNSLMSISLPRFGE